MTQLHAGFGSGVITPPVPLRLAGFGDRVEPATQVHDDLEARVLVLGVGDGAVCLIVCDLLGMSAEFADPVRAAVGEVTGLPRERVLTACTHTHTGPNAMHGGELLGWATPEGYVDVLVDGCRAAATAAMAAREPATLAYARAPLPDGLSINRRDLPYSPTFAVLDVRRPDGSRIGTVANIGIHPVALGPQCLAVSTDWVGPFRAALEAAAGGTAVLLQGALGDVNPAEPHHHDDTGNYDDAARLGGELAAAVAGVLEAGAPLAGDVDLVAARTVEAPVGTTPLAMLTNAAGTRSIELVEWELGGVRLVSLPGEAFHAFGRQVEEARGDAVLLAGLAPEWHGYLPVPFGLGYEETVSFGEEAVQAILTALLEVPSR